MPSKGSRSGQQQLIFSAIEEELEIENRCLTVSQLTAHIESLINDDPILGSAVVVEGEVSNVKQSSRGHLYFTLKDEHATIKAKMWASQVKLLPFDLEDGMAVYLTGQLEIYAPHGEYSLTARKLEPVGVGSLQLAFQQIKEKLEAEGLFLDEHKKPLPDFPLRIGIITSRTGAVIHDMLRVIRRKNPLVHVLIHPVKVQGEGASEEIMAAIEELNHPHHQLDLLIVARGGGSFEDLFCFSHEGVVRSLFASNIPVITGIGHEPDFSLADAVSDYSASTPTAAAEAAVPDIDLMREALGLYQEILLQASTQSLEVAEQSFDYAVTRFIESTHQMLNLTAHKLERLTGELETLSPLKTLARGYTLVSEENNQLLTSVGKLKPKDKIQLRFYDGKAICEVQEIYANSKQP